MNIRYGKLTILKEVEKLILPCGQKNRAFLCRCDCGKEKVIRMVHLTNGRILTCGCLGKEIYGESKSKIYKLWNSIKTRCKENYFESEFYYKKGIRVCDLWLNSFQEFKKFALSNGYKEGLTIDRIDSNGNYEPNNVRFVTPKENCNNRKNTYMVIYNGESISLQILLEKLKYKGNITTIYARLKRGYSIENALSKPIGKNYIGRLNKQIS